MKKKNEIDSSKSDLHAFWGRTVFVIKHVIDLLICVCLSRGSGVREGK